MTCTSGWSSATHDPPLLNSSSSPAFLFVLFSFSAFQFKIIPRHDCLRRKDNPASRRPTSRRRKRLRISNGRSTVSAVVLLSHLLLHGNKVRIRFLRSSVFKHARHPEHHDPLQLRKLFIAINQDSTIGILTQVHHFLPTSMDVDFPPCPTEPHRRQVYPFTRTHRRHPHVPFTQ